MKDNKNWTTQQRRASLELTKKAIAAGRIKSPNELGCSRCKQKKGIIEYHNHNYDDPVKYLEPLCYTCHLVYHNYHNNPERCMDYWDRVRRGYQAPPVFDKGQCFNVMAREGIFKGKHWDK